MSDLIEVDAYLCVCGNKGSKFYYDTNPKDLPPLRKEDGAVYTCLFGVPQTGEPGAVRCMECDSLEVEISGSVLVPETPSPGMENASKGGR